MVSLRSFSKSVYPSEKKGTWLKPWHPLGRRKLTVNLLRDIYGESTGRFMTNQIPTVKVPLDTTGELVRIVKHYSFEGWKSSFEIHRRWKTVPIKCMLSFSLLCLSPYRLFVTFPCVRTSHHTHHQIKVILLGFLHSFRVFTKNLKLITIVFNLLPQI